MGYNYVVCIQEVLHSNGAFIVGAVRWSWCNHPSQHIHLDKYHLQCISGGSSCLGSYGGPLEKAPVRIWNIAFIKASKEGPDGSAGSWWIFQAIQFMTQRDTWNTLEVTFPTFDFGSRFFHHPKKGHVCRIARLIPSVKLTVRTWKWMVGIPSFPFGHRPIFRCVLLLVSGRVTPSLLIQFATFLVVTSLRLFFQQVVEAWPCCERLKGCNFNRMLEGNSFTGMRWGSKKVGKTLYNPFPEN